MADDAPFTRALWQMEQAFGLDTIDIPDLGQWEPEDPKTKDEIPRLFDICERRLRENREAFEMRSYLVLASVLDRLLQDWEDGKSSLEKTRTTLRTVLDKIGEKVRAHAASYDPNP